MKRPGTDRGIWYARTYTKWSGSGQRLMVLKSQVVKGKVWLKVRLPVRPNNSAGWIPRDRVSLGHTSRYIVVDTSERRVRVYSKGRVVSSFRVVVGAPETPTPAGLFAIYDRVKQRDPKGFVGPWVLPLTAHSRQLQRYDGGPGLVAFHGRDGASLLDPLGSARSHGCIRMKNSRIRALLKLPQGTAVKVRR
jgi:lipoprotein-anchoring transpeptidase ErfK/SrfK